jgi:hypothetical protein
MNSDKKSAKMTNLAPIKNNFLKNEAHFTLNLSSPLVDNRSAT